MKLLLDQNLSYALTERLQGLFPGSAHVRDFKLTEADDEEVWEYAKALGYCITTKDEDFHEMSELWGIRRKWFGYDEQTVRQMMF